MNKLDPILQKFIYSLIPKNTKSTEKMVELLCANSLKDPTRDLEICLIFYSKLSDSAALQLFLFSIQAVTTIFFAYLT